jgi:hypothetical protein
MEDEKTELKEDASEDTPELTRVGRKHTIACDLRS